MIGAAWRDSRISGGHGYRVQLEFNPPKSALNHETRHRKKLENKGLRHTWGNQLWVAGSNPARFTKTHNKNDGFRVRFD
jgi:hypothetical protein